MKVKYKYIVAVWNEYEEYVIHTFDTYVESFCFYRDKQHDSKWLAGFLYDNEGKEYFYSFEKKEGVYTDKPSFMMAFFDRYKNTVIRTKKEIHTNKMNMIKQYAENKFKITIDTL